MSHNKVYLIGFMGCGKTTTGKLLAKITGFTLIDTDSEIENETGKTVSEIFSSEGETAFRELELKIISRYFNSSGNFIISTGGGLPCFHDLMNRLIQDGKTVYIKCEEEILEERIKKNLNQRPLLSENDIRKTISDKLKERTPIYEKASIIVNGNQCPEKVAAEILKKLR